MPRSELVRSWDDFTRRAGFVHQLERRKARRQRIRRWIKRTVLFAVVPVLALAVLLGGIVMVSFWAASPNRHEPGLADVGWTELAPAAVTDTDSTGWATIGNTRVKLDPGAKLFKATKPGYANLVKLEGSARFLRVQSDESTSSGDTALFSVFTAAGYVASPMAEFRVSAHGDTTDVDVVWRAAAPEVDPQRSAARYAAGRMTRDVVILANGPGDEGGVLLLSAGEAGRLQLGARPLQLRDVPGDPASDNWFFKRMAAFLAPRMLP
jgi:hypothetical protein